MIPPKRASSLAFEREAREELRKLVREVGRAKPPADREESNANE